MSSGAQKKSPFATEEDYDPFQAPKIKGTFVPNPYTQPFAVEPTKDATGASSNHTTFVAPTVGDYPAHIRASSERSQAPFAMEHDAPAPNAQRKPKGEFQPKDNGFPYAVAEAKNSYKSSNADAFGPKGVVYTGPAKAKTGDSNGGVPYATDNSTSSSTADAQPTATGAAAGKSSAGAKPTERERVPWALVNDEPSEPEYAKGKRTISQKQGNTQPW